LKKWKNLSTRENFTEIGDADYVIQKPMENVRSMLYATTLKKVISNE